MYHCLGSTTLPVCFGKIPFDDVAERARGGCCRCNSATCFCRCFERQFRCRRLYRDFGRLLPDRNSGSVEDVHPCLDTKVVEMASFELSCERDRDVSFQMNGRLDGVRCLFSFAK